MKQLFEGVNLVLDVTWLDSLPQINLARLAPFVQRMAFAPPLYNWLVDEQTFNLLLKQQADADPTKYHSPPQRKKAYKKYAAIAERNRVLIHDQSSILVIKIMRFLALFPRCQEFSFTHINHATFDNELRPDFPASLWIPAHDDRGELLMPTLQAADLANALALEAIRRSNIDIRSISLRHPMTGGTAWSSNLRHQLLRLQNIEKLDVVHTHPYNSGTDQDQTSEASQVADDLMYLISGCSRNLADLHCFGWELVEWRTRSASVQAMPNLIFLELATCDISSVYLTTWISTAKKLKAVQLYSVALVEGESEERWRDVFDAIRDHSNAISLQFRPLYVHEDDFMLESFETHRPRLPLRVNDGALTLHHENEDMHEAVKRVLPLYLDGQVEWGGVLASSSMTGERTGSTYTRKRRACFLASFDGCYEEACYEFGGDVAFLVRNV